LTELYPPSDELEVVLESHMPAVLAVGTPGLWVGTLRLTNTAFGGIEAIDVDRLTFRSADREFVPVGLGEVASSMSVLLDGEPWAFVGGLSKADSMTLVSGQVISLGPGESAELEIRIDLQSATAAGSFRMGVDQADVGVVAGTGSALLGVRVTTEPGEVFPLWTEAGGFTAPQLEDSYANFPNPFAAGRETTTIVYSLASPASITLRVLSARGEPVITLRSDEPRNAGLYQDDIWNGRNARGTTVVNGVYLAELMVTYDDGTSERLLRKIAVVR